MGKLAFITHFFGNVTLNSVQPWNKRKTKAPTLWEPSQSNLGSDLPYRFEVCQNSLKDYSKIVLSDRQILTKVSIGHFAFQLLEDQFIRVHTSFVVAIDKISAYTAHDVEIGEIELRIGRLYNQAFHERMNNSQ